MVVHSLNKKTELVLIEFSYIFQFWRNIPYFRFFFRWYPSEKDSIEMRNHHIAVEGGKEWKKAREEERKKRKKLRSVSSWVYEAYVLWMKYLISSILHHSHFDLWMSNHRRNERINVLWWIVEQSLCFFPATTSLMLDYISLRYGLSIFLLAFHESRLNYVVVMFRLISNIGESFFLMESSECFAYTMEICFDLHKVVLLLAAIYFYKLSIEQYCLMQLCNFLFNRHQHLLNGRL